MKLIFNRLRERLIEESLSEARKISITTALKLVNEAEAKFSKEFVSLETYKQVAWERDIAIEQLRELGYELGEKIREAE